MRIALVAILALAAGCAGAEPVVLRIAPAPGSVFVRELQESLEGSLTIRAEGKETRQALFKDEHRVVEDEILETDGQRVLRVRRKTLEWTLRRQGPRDPAPVAVPRTLHGKTIVLRRTELGTEHDGAEGVPADELRSNPIDALDALLSLPDGPVAPGATWDIDGDRVVDVFGGDGDRGLKVREARGTARLERIEAGVAVIRVQIEAEGALRQLLDVDVALKVEGTFRIDPVARRPVSFEAKAVGTLAGEVDRSGKPAVYEGGFTLRAKGASRPR